MLTPNEQARLATCRHEAGHAIAAWAVGAPVHYVLVPQLNAEGRFDMPAPRPRASIDVEGKPLHALVAIAMAGVLAEKGLLSLADFRRDFGAAKDASDAQKAAWEHFSGGREVVPGSRLHRVVSALVDRYLRRSLERVHRWVALPQQDYALQQMVAALSSVPRLDADKIAHICESCGVEPHSHRLVPLAAPCHFRAIGQ